MTRVEGPFTATYRMQLREGVDFAAAARFLPWLARSGFSHLYLAPIFTACAGSTHGYDVADPTEIDPVLGGEAGFVALSEAARAQGIGILLDIVPNHLAFSLDNPWLRDVLRHGEESRYARHFDVDWSQRLILPFLEAPFEEMLAEGRLGTGMEDGRPVFTADDLAIPLRAPPGGTDALSTDALRALHDAQSWRLTYWERERRSITHRRFFNVTGLIGMRVEDPQVFDAMQARVFDLVDRGLVAGLRVDHVDGLADPEGYLIRLRSRVGDIPVWIEKILTGTEALPDWPVAGTTGYEAARTIARLLTDADGHAALLAQWREATGIEGSFHDAVLRAKGDVIGQDLPAEFHQTVELAQAALNLPFDDALREAVLALLIAFPRYRTYVSDDTVREEDRSVMTETCATAERLLSTGTAMRALRRSIRKSDRDEAAPPGTQSRQTEPMFDAAPAPEDVPGGLSGRLFGDGTGQPAEAGALLSDLAALVTDATTPEARAFRVRFQQVTGALLAKAHEDCAAFRWNPYLAANEVGADPDAPTIGAEELEDWLSARRPMSLTLTASHDTKRSGDARMRLVAISHLPEAFASLCASLSEVPGASRVSRNRRWYLAQSALAIWDPEDRDLADRLADHMTKALREARQITIWAHPDEDAEATVTDLARALVGAWCADPPEALAALIARGTGLSLVQTAIALLLPGVPDVYGAGMGLDLALTDPDNRRPADLARMEALTDRDDASGAKARLTVALLLLRRRMPAFFAGAGCTIDKAQGMLTRHEGGTCVTLRFDPGGGPVAPGTFWPQYPKRDGCPLAIDIA